MSRPAARTQAARAERWVGPRRGSCRPRPTPSRQRSESGTHGPTHPTPDHADLLRRRQCARPRTPAVRAGHRVPARAAATPSSPATTRCSACARAIRSCGSTPTPWRAPIRGWPTASSPVPARYETTLTRPDLFARLLPRAVRAAAAQPRRAARGRHQRAADPDPLLLRRARPRRGHADARAPPAAARPVRPARPRRDGRRHRQRHVRAAEPASRSRCRCSPRRGSTTRCTGCATTPAPRPSTSRTSCCSRTTSSTSTNSSRSAAS